MRATKVRRLPGDKAKELVAQTEDLIRQGSIVKDACATIGINPSMLYAHRVRHKKQPTKAIPLANQKLKFCPQCGCNLQVVNAALSL